jgi:predicted transcriptional regulator
MLNNGHRVQTYRKITNKAEAIRLSRKSGWNTRRIARYLGLTSRTVLRYLEEDRNERAGQA